MTRLLWIKNISWLLVLVAGLGVSGCGYSTRSALPSSWRTICVLQFANKVDYTSESKRSLYLPLLEVKVGSAVISRFQYDGNLKIAKSDTADLVLEGELVDYDRAALRYDNNDNVTEYRVRIVTNLKLTEGKDGEVIWEEQGFAGEASYFASGAQGTSETSAVENAIQDLARRIVERTIENW